MTARHRPAAGLAAGLLAAALTAAPCAPAMAAAPRASSPAGIADHAFRSSDGVRLHVLQSGPADPASAIATIVLVPGWSMPASLFRPQLLALGRRHHVIAFDPRGQGRSQLAREGYHIDRRADDLHELLSQAFTGQRDVVLVGWSLGALEALQYLHRHGDGRLAALVLVDSSVGEGPGGPPSRFPDELRRNRRKAVTDFVQAIFKRPLPARDLRALVDGALRMPLQASLSLFPSAIAREHWRGLARGFAKPLLYAVTPQFAGQARELAAHRPGTRTAVFENAGHALFVDEAGAFNRLLEDFVAKSGAGAAGQD